MHETREPSEAEGIGSLLKAVIGDLGVEEKMAQAQAVLTWPEVAEGITSPPKPFPRPEVLC